MWWTDERLAHTESYYRRLAAEYTVATGLKHTAEDDCEIYRLARLGLAAEQAGQKVFRDNLDFYYSDSLEMGAINHFLNHPAWEKAK